MIESAEQLDACLGAAPAAVELKVIDQLDEGALRWLAASSLAFLSAAPSAGVEVTIAGGEPGFARAPKPDRLWLAYDTMDHALAPGIGRGIGALFLVAGLGETLRINGRVVEQTTEGVALAIDEVYVHCAKALIRSDFWAAPPRRAPLDARAFVEESRFVALATSDAEGRADLSPKGDAAGRMLQLDGDALSYAERPGNRRKDSLTNLLKQPRAAMVALIPGSTVVGVAEGRAQLLDEPAAREAFTAESKTPKLVTKLGNARLTLRESAALQRAALWPLRPIEHGLDPAAIMTAHVKQSRASDFGTRMVQKLASRKLMDLSLRLDYKHKLY